MVVPRRLELSNKSLMLFDWAGRHKTTAEDWHLSQSYDTAMHF
jgi:hypothetical protein